MFAYQTKSEDIGDQGVMSGFSGAEYNMNDFRGCRPSLMFLIGSCEAKELLQTSPSGKAEGRLGSSGIHVWPSSAGQCCLALGGLSGFLCPKPFGSLFGYVASAAINISQSFLH